MPEHRHRYGGSEANFRATTQRGDSRACDDGPVGPPITFAHRGGQPENTLAAFRSSLAAGATGVETDARVAGDGAVVLAHDARLRDGWRRRRVAATPAEELARFAVPRVADLYAALGSDYELSVDLKVAGVGDPLIELADGVGAVDRLWLCSPELDTLESLRGRGARLVHSVRRRAVDGGLERHAARLHDSGVDVMNMPWVDWTSGLVALFQRFGVRAFAWGVNEERQLRAAVAAGVDAIYSDRVDLMLKVVRATA